MGNQDGVARLRIVARRCAIVSLAIGVSGLCGWYFDVPLLRTLLRDGAPLRPNAAALLIVAGLATYWFERERYHRARIVMGSLVLVLAFATLTQDLTGRSYGIDDVLVAGVQTRMPPYASAMFMALGTAIALSARFPERRRWWRSFAILAAGSACTVLFGYVFQVERLYAHVFDGVIALPAALGIFLSAMAIILGSPNIGVSRWIRSNSAAWPLFRRMLWLSFAVPIVAGILVRQGVLWGFYGEAFAFAAFTAVSTTSLVLLAFLVIAPIAAAEEARGIAARALEQSENDLRITLDSIGDAVVATDEHGRITRMNPVAEKLTGWKLAEAQWRPIEDVVHTEGVANAMAIVSRNGRRTEIADSSAPIRDAEGNTRGFVLVFRDVTAARRTEDQLRQAQKMDAIGRLAGGIAHDFNNILSVVLSLSDLLLEDIPPGAPHREEIGEIGAAGRRAATLTRQLLRFSRHELVSPRVVNLNQVITNIDQLLRRLVRENVTLQIAPGDDLGNVRIDVGSVEQVLLNLVVNARDAIPGAGTISIETKEVDIDAGYAAAHPGSTVGKHVMLAVSDNGVGMDRTTQARIFEPFFTTKSAGQGTGLGLASVFGVMKQCGGSVYVYSELGIGTTFKLYFPVVDMPLDRVAEKKEDAALGGTETILLVEDEPQVRAVALAILRGRGYTVIEARSGEEALDIVSDNSRRIHLLVTDVIMPGMSGFELAQQVKKMRPETRVLCMSGYTDKGVLEHGLQEADAFLQKPITPESLSRKIREVLNA